MLALFFMMQEPDVNAQQIIQAQNAGIYSQIKQEEAKQYDDAVPADWAGPAAARPGVDKKVQEFDPSKPLYVEPNLCVVIPGQPAPECATQFSGNQQSLVLNNDIFGQSVGGGDSTCQMVETIRRDANGNAKKVFATYCGDELGATDYRERVSPTGSEAPVKPTDRTFGPQSMTNQN